MYIKEVCLDGFKSYAQRTVITGFDPFFNAITGLNGSGKSNILDAICFLLGLSKLSQVRAANLQELVYKQGQAGITKASVAITFDNSDKNQSPAGYEDVKEITVTRQVVLGGRNKYLINGHLAQPSMVQMLFHSVQLNVDNPHFLIMQGRITKVLNMKPPEILSMIEEAAGTSMYEMKRADAFKTLTKKEAKLVEIDKVLNEEITPSLGKMRKDWDRYQQWQVNEKDLDALKRFCLAYDFHVASNTLDGAAGHVSALQTELAERSELESSLQASIEAKEKEIIELTEQRERQQGPDIKRLAAQVEELSKELVKQTAAWTNSKETYDSEVAAKEKQESNAWELEASISAQENAIAGSANNCKGTKDSYDRLRGHLDDLKAELQAAQAGRMTGAGGKSLGELLGEAHAAVKSMETEAKQWRIKGDHAEKELVRKRAALRKAGKESASMQTELEQANAAVDMARKALEAVTYDSEHVARLHATQATLNQELQRCQQQFDAQAAEVSMLNFSYADPEQGFDRHRVKGLVARLMRVKDRAASTAIEVTAGGKLYNVVVDTEQTGKLLLSKGQLRSRVTIIPLNKIDARVVSDAKQAAARQLGGAEKASLALSVVGYEKDVAQAMAYVFGGTFVCKDSATAEKVAFNKDVLTPCVTLEGDIFNPQGTLTGGSRSQSASLLLKLHELNNLEDDLRARKQKLAEVDTQVAATAKTEGVYKQLLAQLQLKEHSLQLLQSRLAQSEYQQLMDATAKLEDELQCAQKAGEASEQKAKEHVQEAAEIEKRISSFDQDREKRITTIQNELKGSDAKLAAASQAVKEVEQEAQRLALELEALRQERSSLEEGISAAALQITEALRVVEQKAEKVRAVSQQYDEAKAQLEEKRQQVRTCDEEVNTRLKKLEADQVNALSVAEKLKQSRPWLLEERHLFGKVGTDYDFNAQSPNEAKSRLEALTKAQEGLSKRVNRKAMSVLEKAEEEYQQLQKKREIVMNDKVKIQGVISELDEKKKDVLLNAWEKVNKDFGNIFSTLLPGTTARLEPEEGHTYMDGLQVKVAFGGVWKESLSEMSGGQKSLLALSLILALLLFKPAPLYILDEVDAALDLSHTQNIGRMIKTHFPYSQFVVVSLKEGMFSNANVIFRTKFVEGVSKVTRTVPLSKRTERQPQQGQQSENRGQPTMVAAR
eukprot:jgi/Chlat1/6321/Chrsp44S05888